MANGGIPLVEQIWESTTKKIFPNSGVENQVSADDVRAFARALFNVAEQLLCNAHCAYDDIDFNETIDLAKVSLFPEFTLARTPLPRPIDVTIPIA